MQSSRDLVNEGAGLVIQFNVRIPQRSLVVFGRASSLQMLLEKLCSIAPKRKKRIIRFSLENKKGIKIG